MCVCYGYLAASYDMYVCEHVCGNLLAVCVYVYVSGLPDYGKILITIILVHNEILIIQTILFEFETMLYLFSMSLGFFFCN